MSDDPKDEEALRATLVAILHLLQVAERHQHATLLHTIDIPLLIAGMRRKLHVAVDEMDGRSRTPSSKNPGPT